MRLLQRYILADLLRVFTFVLSILTVLLVFVGVFREVTESGLGPLQALQILPYIIPSMLPYTIPATLLLSVCVVYGRMAGDQEITAAKAAGISVMALLAPSFFFGAVVSVCSLLLTDQVIPWAESNILRVVTAAMEQMLLDKLGTEYQASMGLNTISVHEVIDKKLILPTFRYFPGEGKPAITARAQEAELLDFDLEKREVRLRFKGMQVDVPGQGRQKIDEWEHSFPLSIGQSQPKDRHINVRAIQQKLTDLQTKHTALQQERAITAALALAIGDYRQLGGHQFKIYDHYLYDNRFKFFRLRTELHSRFALACSCFFFVLVGSPFAVLQAKRQFLTNFFICFVPIVLLYYPLVLLAKNLSSTGTLDAAWAMWVGNVLMAFAGLFVLRRVTLH